ncbi:MAG: HD domain-containing protein [Desulfobacterales bacterium]|nr:HD domain-containing protein [Desulfobacterales bacterium]
MDTNKPFITSKHLGGQPEADRFKTYFRLFTDISKQIHANTKTTDILACIVSNITQILGAKGAIFWILNTTREQIQTKISHGFDYRSLSLVDYPTLVTLFDPSVKDLIHITDARNDKRIPDLERLGKHLINAIAGLYVDITGPYKGLLAVYFTGNRTVEEDELELLSALSEQGAIALEKAIGYDREMLDLYGQIIQGLTLAIEAKDPATHGHSLTVARLAKATALQLKLNDDTANQVYHAAILHDIGKIGTRDHILDRLGKLTSKEMEMIRRHPELGADILSPLSFLGDIAPLVRSHHELYNGKGYPDGIKGDQIPIGARIITVCDAFETMITGRPGIPKKSLAAALTDLKQGVGSRFDPMVVQAFFDMIQIEKDILATGESIDNCLDILTQNMGKLADQNRIEKKLANPFSGFF